MAREVKQKKGRRVKLVRGGPQTRARVIFYLIVEEKRMVRVSEQGDQRQTEGDRDGEAEMRCEGKADIPDRVKLLSSSSVFLAALSLGKYSQTLNPDTVCSFCAKDGR